MTHFETWKVILALILNWASPRFIDVGRLQELSKIAWSITQVTNDGKRQAMLAAIASYESGFRIRAIGKRGERGPWQLMFLSSGCEKDLTCQAAEALRRINYSYDRCGDLTFYVSGQCGIGLHVGERREERAKQWAKELVQ